MFDNYKKKIKSFLIRLTHIHLTTSAIVFTNKVSRFTVSLVNLKRHFSHFQRFQIVLNSNYCYKPQTAVKSNENSNLFLRSVHSHSLTLTGIRVIKVEVCILDKFFNRFYTSLLSAPASWPKYFIRGTSRSLRHRFQQQQLPQKQPQQYRRFFNMGSINCKEYVTNNDACANPPENGK